MSFHWYTNVCGTVESVYDLIMMMAGHGNLTYVATVKYKAVTTELILLYTSWTTVDKMLSLCYYVHMNYIWSTPQGLLSFEAAMQDNDIWHRSIAVSGP